MGKYRKGGVRGKGKTGDAQHGQNDMTETGQTLAAVMTGQQNKGEYFL